MADNEKSNWYIVLAAVVVVAIVLVVIVSLSQDTTRYGMMRGGAAGFGWLFMFVPITLIIVIVYALMDRDRGPYCQSSNYGSENSIQIVERRYANGEISREQYIQMKEDLLKI